MMFVDVFEKLASDEVPEMLKGAQRGSRRNSDAAEIRAPALEGCNRPFLLVSRD
jgi:hypothetical protein